MSLLVSSPHTLRNASSVSRLRSRLIPRDEMHKHVVKHRSKEKKKRKGRGRIEIELAVLLSYPRSNDPLLWRRVTMSDKFVQIAPIGNPDLFDTRRVLLYGKINVNEWDSTYATNNVIVI
jgi:hypothetical protein